MLLSRVCGTIMLFLVMSAQAVATDWTPPENPDLLEVLNEVRLDVEAERYEAALEKLIWFHHYAEQVGESVSGARLSYALYDWVELGQEYPPAMDRLLDIRASLVARLMHDEYDGSAFHDLVSINAVLGEESKTTEIFKLIDSRGHEIARRAFFFAKTALIKDKEYGLYVKYVNPQNDFISLKDGFESRMSTVGDSELNASRVDSYHDWFRNEVATLVAILVVNGREQEAAEISVLAKEVLDDPQFHEELEDALAGNVPAPLF